MDYCPECGSCNYEKGTVCRNCGFPHPGESNEEDDLFEQAYELEPEEFQDVIQRDLNISRPFFPLDE